MDVAQRVGIAVLVVVAVSAVYGLLSKGRSVRHGRGDGGAPYWLPGGWDGHGGRDDGGGFHGGGCDSGGSGGDGGGGSGG